MPALLCPGNVPTMHCIPLVLLLAWPLAAAPLRLHPDNPHYFEYHGRPEIIVTSGEHYGAVINSDFDFAKYLDTLKRDGMNATRTFSGAYCENPGAFKIEKNTLAPASALLCPWARSTEAGYAGGGNKFDLTKWDPAYFARLTDFVAQAEKRNIIVEFTLFCPFYDDAVWALSPQNVRNNVNGIGTVPRDRIYTLDQHGGLLSVHESLTRKLVTELNRFDNLILEICNEPYFGGVTEAWQHRIADVIVETEKSLPKQHLISQNIANHKARVVNPHPAVRVFNFHYAFLPETVTLNYGLNRVIGDNETGFKGTADAHYRMEAWAFLLNGGALFNHLDYSFAVGHEDGTFAYPSTQPGGGSATLRRQLRDLAGFLRSFDFVKMRPAPDAVKIKPPGKRHTFCLTEPGRQHASYTTGPAKGLTLTVEIPTSRYSGFWLDPVTGNRQEIPVFHHAGGPLSLPMPDFPDGAALKLCAVSGG